MKYAICNETFENWTHDRICGFVREAGYLGLEMAPFTLADRITNVSTAMRAKLKKEAEAEGIKIIGLHWLLAKTEGSAIRRIGHQRWLRNTAVALGNAPVSAIIIDALKAKLNHPSEMVREHVQWALAQHNL